MDQRVCKKLDDVSSTPFIAMILLSKSGRLQCMGSIIDEYHILTARDCVNEIDAPSLMVVAGYASPYFGRNSQVKFVDRITKHGDANLAILYLLRPFTFTRTVQPIRLIGPQKMNDKFSSAYSEFKPYRVAGIALPSKLEPQQGNPIPKGLTYQFIASELFEHEDCLDKFDFGGFERESMNEDFNFCTDGDAQFCWTVQGSPTVGVFGNTPVQIAIVTFAACRHLPPVTESDDSEFTDYTPYEHIRIDWCWNWIKKNSFATNELRV